MRISVVIPARDEQALLPLCLRSLREQRLRPHQVIVIDNGSSDRTAEVARRMGAMVLRETRTGISHARQRGFMAASGDIIARCDADSILPTDWTAQLARRFRDDSSLDAVTGPGRFYDLPAQGLAMWGHRQVYFNLFGALAGGPILFGSNMAIRRDAWRQIQDVVCLDDRAVHEDMDVGLHLMAAGGRLAFYPELVVQISGRRVRAARSLGEYFWRSYRTVRDHGRPALSFEPKSR